MKKILYIFRNDPATPPKMSPEEMQDHMKAWMVWMQELSEKKLFIDGLPLAPEGKRVSADGSVVTDGPFMEGKEVVGGYMLIYAESLAHATELSKACPIFDYGGQVEIRETMSMEQ